MPDDLKRALGPARRLSWLLGVACALGLFCGVPVPTKMEWTHPLVRRRAVSIKKSGRLLSQTASKCQSGVSDAPLDGRSLI